MVKALLAAVVFWLLRFPCGKEIIKERAASKNQSVNAYIYELIKKDMEMSGM